MYVHKTLCRIFKHLKIMMKNSVLRKYLPLKKFENVFLWVMSE